jgi:hemolysin activation/secretion protein
MGGDMKVVLRSLTGLGDTLELNFDKTEGSISGSMDYSLPITPSDTFLRFSYDINDSEVVESPFKAVEIESKSETIKLFIDHPLYLTPSQRLTVGITLEQRKSKTLLLGVPFSFSPGVNDGKSRVTALRFYQGWLDRSRTRVVAARSTFTLGIPGLGGTKNVAAPDSEYFTWLGQMQVAQRLWESDSQLVFRADVQLSADQLLPIEKFSIGGANSIRGYRENQLVRDNGFVLSIEGRFPVGKVTIPGLSKGVDAGTIYLAPFFDLGRSWENKNIATPSPHNLYSAGLGVRWDISADLQFQIYWGYAFRKIDNPDNDLQDEGIHFLLSKQVF